MQRGSLLFDHLRGVLRVIDDGFDFAAMADDAFVLKQTFNVVRSEVRDSHEIEMVKGGAKIFPFARMVRQLSPDWKPSRLSFSNKR